MGYCTVPTYIGDPDVIRLQQRTIGTYINNEFNRNELTWSKVKKKHAGNVVNSQAIFFFKAKNRLIVYNCIMIEDR